MAIKRFEVRTKISFTCSAKDEEHAKKLLNKFMTEANVNSKQMGSFASTFENISDYTTVIDLDE